jgi:hypothetical protein
MPDQDAMNASRPAGSPEQSTVDNPDAGTTAQTADLTGVAEPDHGSPADEVHPNEARDPNSTTYADPAAVRDSEVAEDSFAMRDSDVAGDSDAVRDPDSVTDPQAIRESHPVHDPDSSTDPDTIRDPRLDLEPDVESRDPSEVRHAQEHPATADGAAAQAVPSQRAASPDDSSSEASPDASSTVDRSGDATTNAEPQAPVELAPGDVQAPSVAGAWTDDEAESLRERWRDLQARFVDDPHGTAAAADDLIGEAVENLTAALAEQRQQLGSWRAHGDLDTERLRVVVTGYREFLDRVLTV